MKLLLCWRMQIGARRDWIVDESYRNIAVKNNQIPYLIEDLKGSIRDTK